MPLCLASASPRRRALLNQIKVPFTVLVVDFDETRLPGEPPNQMVVRLASGKATTAKSQTHQVYTGIALLSGAAIQTQTVMSEVTFTRLTSAQIENYSDGTEPFDKAGAYAIQGVGAIFISHISGSYSNIMGLPLHETYAMLTEAGWSGS